MTQILMTSVVIGERQRTELGDIKEMAESLERNGLLHPIVLEDSTNVLLAGERRFRAAESLGWEMIACTFKSDLNEADRKSIELEENIKRKDLTWQERADALLQYHELLGEDKEATAKATGYSIPSIEKNIRAAIEIRDGDEKVAAAPHLGAADRVVTLKNKRALDAALADLTSGKTLADPDETIVCTDFLEWAAHWKGRKFNLIHCDFPYGIGHDKSEQGGSKHMGAYEDSEETYWKLCSGLCDHADRILQSSAHMLFWFSMNYYCETLRFFSNRGWRVQPYPLIWHKSDSKGIIPDVERGPRRVYETCLLMSRGDRRIIGPVDNHVGFPTTKEHHISEKPVPVICHFMKMLVDETTEALDPTAGSGNALIAADYMGAKRVLGLELNPEYAKIANVNYRSYNRESKDFGIIKEQI